MILTEEDTKLGDAIRLGKEEGMQDFTESLKQLVQAERIERATAFEDAPNVEQLKMSLKGINVAQPGILDHAWPPIPRRRGSPRAGRHGVALSVGGIGNDDSSATGPALSPLLVLGAPRAPVPPSSMASCSQMPQIVRGPGLYLNLLKLFRS